MNYTAKVLAVLAIVAADPYQVVEEGSKSPTGITNERVREHDVWGVPEQASRDYTSAQAGPVPVTLETENVRRHREHNDPVDKLHSQVVDEGVEPLLDIVREHFVWRSPEQGASDESDYTGTQAGHLPANMGSTLEAIDSIDEDLLQKVFSSSDDVKLLELGIGKLDTDHDAITSNLINRHREHTTTLTATDWPSPGIQMGLYSNHSDSVDGLDDSMSNEDFDLIPEPTKTEATASAQVLFSSMQTQNVAPTETTLSRLRMREHDAETTTVGDGEGGEMFSSDYHQILSASGTSAVQEFQNPTFRKRAHTEPTGMMVANQQPGESSNEEQFPSRAPDISSHQDEPEKGLNRRRKHDADAQLVSNAPSNSGVHIMSNDFGLHRTPAQANGSKNFAKYESATKQTSLLSNSPSTTPSVSEFPSASTTPSQSPSSSGMPSSQPSTIPSGSRKPSSNPSEPPSTSGSPSSVFSEKPSVSGSPSSQPSASPSSQPSAFPTRSGMPSSVPSQSPTASGMPSSQPSLAPSLSGSPSSVPSQSPSASGVPSRSPDPTGPASSHPSFGPSISSMPSAAPSAAPSTNPSESPSVSTQPSLSSAPSSQASGSPSVSAEPSSLPSMLPSTTIWPTRAPSDNPTSQPSMNPSVSDWPTSMPSESPSTSQPSASPSSQPSAFPTRSGMPSSVPSQSPTASGMPSSQPNLAPSFSDIPTSFPSFHPSLSGRPSSLPSLIPSFSLSPSFQPSLLPSPSPPVVETKSTVITEGALTINGEIPGVLGVSRSLRSSRRLSVSACNAYVTALEDVFSTKIANGFNGTDQVLISFGITSIDCNAGTRGQTSEVYELVSETLQSCMIGDEGCSENGKDDSVILNNTLIAVKDTVDNSITDSFNVEFSAAFSAIANETGIDPSEIAAIADTIANSEPPANEFDLNQDAQIETVVVTMSPTTSPTSSPTTPPTTTPTSNVSYEDGAKCNTQ
ncbi:hypothetical protein THAOC_07155 [Thalassiosira oceanica]|uniref:Uncharacterized protein n=1 Tax=Thalassiosira oceanica TaxID=159749 RepID=K0T0Z8_THAOC|nr:hypothetical protein THAOC_07155 [Thalassiosira oceanica]|eukprot:EJK71410.1 hypothetical protein THAOC_07155 [Thalassiosira oceanica]